MSKSLGYGRTQLSWMAAGRSIRMLADPAPTQIPARAQSFLKACKPQSMFNPRLFSLSSVPEQQAVLNDAPSSVMFSQQDAPVYRIESNETGQYIVASTHIPAGAIILTETGTVTKTACKYSLQLGEGYHLLMPGDIKLANHACNSAANCIFELHTHPKEHGRLVAMRDINSGEALSFDYCTTEWDMESPFDCVCGAPTCRGRITGRQDCCRSMHSRCDVWF